MSYQALARKWRPKAFAEVIGQTHVVTALANALDSQRVHHAFLFTGTRGVGKTTLARIFAKALNCEKGVSSSPCGECVACAGVDQGNFVDLIEVDAASRTKVDDTRELLENVQYRPTQGRMKIYLIDEVHMLSTHSFNALLKTLEEPPEHVKFLLATTDPQKLPMTILSRCIQFNLQALDIVQLGEHFTSLLEAEKIKHDKDAVAILARAADGSVRDGLSLLDQAIAVGNGEVKTDAVRAMLGMIDNVYAANLLRAILQRRAPDALQAIADMSRRAVDYAAALDETLSMIHDMALLQVDAKAVEWKGVDTAALTEIAADADAEILQLLYQIALIGKRDMQLAPDPRSGFEMVVLRMLAFQPTGADAPVRQAAPQSNKAAPQPAQAAPPPAQAPAAAPVAPVDADKKLTLDELMTPQGWGEFIVLSGASGMTREMMSHMLPQSIQDSRLHFALNQEHAHLSKTGRVQKITQLINDHTASEVQIFVDAADTQTLAHATPSQQQTQQKEAAQSAAHDAFTADANVQDMMKAFDAVVDTNSIKPAEKS